MAAALAAAPSDARAQSAADRVRAADGWFARVAAVVAAVRDGLYRADELVMAPVDAPVASEFGFRRDPITRRRRLHKGLDFDADRGTPVRAAAPGRVVRARRKGAYGRVVVIDHGGGLTTVYAHLQRIRVRRGDLVPAGHIVGTVGSSGRTTGPHLHFEVHRDGKAIDPRRELPDSTGLRRQRGAGS